jgi:orotidine-5'-phosphate decarboxylase
MFTVHASGGRKMLEACVAAARKASAAAGKREPIVLGVTVLTSMDVKALNDELRVPGSVSDQVLNLSRLCASSGVTGIVASPEEVTQIRRAVGEEMILVTPGVRPQWADANDQSRVMTPADALKAGSDYLVIGRPITASADRKDAARRIVEEMESALAAV